MSDEGSVVTTGDVEDLNEAIIRRAGFFAGLAGTALIIVGGVGVAAWLWLVVRQQMRAGDAGGFTFDPDGEKPSFAGRIDLITGTLGFLVQAVIGMAVGVAIRLVSAVLLARAGQSLTGFEPGDPFPTDAQP